MMCSLKVSLEHDSTEKIQKHSIGYLGSSHDEERSQMRYVMRFAGPVSH